MFDGEVIWWSEALDDLFSRMSVEDWAAVDAREVEDTMFYPSPGDEVHKGSEGYKFFVITIGQVPGIYTQWSEVAPKVNGFSGAVHHKIKGWSKAVEHLRTALEEQKKAACIKKSPRRAVSTQHTPRSVVYSGRSCDITLTSTSTPTHRLSSRPNATTPSTPSRSARTVPTPHLHHLASSKEIRMMYILEAMGSSSRPIVYGNERAAEQATQRALDEEGGFETLEGTDSVQEAIHCVGSK
ncbi:hypothetical protein VKT23_014619 [Stygiomarasmius scandens]|uniref:Ribonuclease H1 N-terminal domain-containing protein n=1 Tax=Marasmiellus scandens TaxID=2682957 RepID=A0ABR1J056_9AGAR